MSGSVGGMPQGDGLGGMAALMQLFARMAATQQGGRANGSAPGGAGGDADEMD